MGYNNVPRLHHLLAMWDIQVGSKTWQNEFFEGKWLVVSTHLKNISHIWNLPQLGVKRKNNWNHHLDHWGKVINFKTPKQKTSPVIPSLFKTVIYPPSIMFFHAVQTGIPAIVVTNFQSKPQFFHLQALNHDGR